MAKQIISTTKLSKVFPNNRGVFDLNLRVNQGEVFGYLGPNGAGKTTTIRVFLDLARASSGSVEIFGLDSRKDSVEIKKRIGFLPGDLDLYDNMTGREFLEYFSSLRGGTDDQYVKELANRLNSNLDHSIGTLSHGNKQKLGLIQAFMHKPELLILDEPTQGLDPLIQHEFYHLIEELKNEGKTVFISSHILPEVERICDRVGIIREGRLIATETIKNLKENALRPIEVQFSQKIKESDFAGLQLENLKIEDKILRCSVKGSMDPFIKRLSSFEILNLVTHEPDLEEIFLKFYEVN